MIANSNNHSSSYSDTSTAPSTSLDSSTNPASTNPTTPAPSSTYDTSTATGGSTPSESQEPAYVVVSMKNGNISGCTTFEPQYNYDIANKLVITSISSDVAVKLVDFYTDKCIRFVFIIKGTTYTVRHIPEGKYYVKIAYGEDWAVKADDPKCEGHFLSDVYFKKGEDVLDFNMTPTANGYEVPSYSLQLSTYVSNGNSSTFSTNTITQNDFENN